MKLLIIHPDRRSADRLRRSLCAHGHVSDIGCDVGDAEALALSGNHNVVLIKDHPEGELAANAVALFHAKFPARLLVFGHQKNAEARVRLLRAGADDYLPEPFALAELLARLDSLCRRETQRYTFESRMALWDVELDMVRSTATRQGQPLRLTNQEFMLLALLMRNAGQVLARSLLRDQIWGESVDCDSNIVDVAVGRLRAKLDRRFEPRLLHTVRGAGYLLEHNGTDAVDSGGAF